MIWTGGANVVAGSFCQAAERSDGQVSGNEDAFDRCQAHHADAAKTWIAGPCGSASVRSLRKNAINTRSRRDKTLATLVVHE